MDELSRSTMERRQVGVLAGNYIVDLGSDNSALYVFRKAVIQGTLTPVYTKVPVTRSLVEAGILLEDGTRDSCLRFRRSGQLVIQALCASLIFPTWNEPCVGLGQ